MGLSFVVCCHNSEQRISVTLGHLLTQSFPEGVLWEIVLVDNASTDNTRSVAESIRIKFNLGGDDFRIISESKLGIGFARYKGIEEARYELVCFIDDDNWVDSTYAREAYSVMSANPKVAACGSLNHVESECDLPLWFAKFQRSYAVGPQSEKPGDVTNVRGVLWSAGMVLRRSAVMELLANGFVPIVRGAKGESSLMRSEDYELCLALKLAGWRIWYEPELKLTHFMTDQRLHWSYLRKLYRGVGESDAGLLPYYLALQKNFQPRQMNWFKLTLKTLYGITNYLHILTISRFFALEGNEKVLRIERSLGLIKSLITQRRTFDQSVRRIKQADWVISNRD